MFVFSFSWNFSSSWNWNDRKTRIFRKKGAQKNGGVKIHPFHLPWIRACISPASFFKAALFVKEVHMWLPMWLSYDLLPLMFNIYFFWQQLFCVLAMLIFIYFQRNIYDVSGLQHESLRRGKWRRLERGWFFLFCSFCGGLMLSLECSCSGL